MLKQIFTSAVVMLLISGSAHAADYTWNGSAGDSDWTNSVNWLGGTYPSALSKLTPPDIIYFSGANMPTTNVPAFLDNILQHTAIMHFNSGGAFTIDLITADATIVNDRGWYADPVGQTVLTVGDGIYGGSENVMVTVTNMGVLHRRYSGGPHIFAVNEDGELHFAGNLGLYGNALKDAVFSISGGVVSVTGTMHSRFNSDTNNYISFTGVGGTFSAKYDGGAFSTFAAVTNDVNDVFKNNTDGEGFFEYIDLGTHFMVTNTAYPPTATTIMVE